MTINEQIERGRQQRRLLARVSRAAWRFEQAEREQGWALASAHVEGVSIRALARAVGLSPSRVHQLVAAADLDALDAALGELRATGWPAPEDPDADEDIELDGRQAIADRIRDEVEWLRRCADWLAKLETGGYPPVVNLRPAADWPDTASVGVNLGYDRDTCKSGNGTERGRRQPPYPAGEWSSASRRSCSLVSGQLGL